MNKFYAFIFALAIVGLIFSEFSVFTLFSAKEKDSNRESVTIATVTDGDTLKLTDGRIIRLLNINSPEKGMPGSNLAADFLNLFINKTLEIEIIGTDKYERNLARIYAPEYLNLAIVERGLASKFLVQESELSKFSKAEKTAIKNSLGIWKKSSFFNCLSAHVDPRKEEATITNDCPEINFKGWMLKDESRKKYSFGNISFSKIVLHSSVGTNNATDLFWNNQGDIWNNDRDSLYLFDSEGGIACYEDYGY